MDLDHWIDWALERQGRPALDTSAELDSARELLDTTIGPLGEPLVAAGAPVPLGLSNSSMAALHQCVTFALSRTGEPDDDVSWALLRGRLLDLYVQHVLFVGRVGDPVEDLRSMLLAEERDDDLAMLDDHLRDDDTEGDLARMAAAAGELEPLGALVPRVEQRVEVDIGGVVSLTGRIDVLVGGPGTGLPGAVVEVKSSGLRSEHMAQVRHYALLEGLREGVAPGAAAVWSPGSGVTDVPVEGSLESSAHRAARAASLMATVWEGEEPGRSPGGHCRWCPELDRCPVGLHDDGDDPWWDA